MCVCACDETHLRNDGIPLRVFTFAHNVIKWQSGERLGVRDRDEGDKVREMQEKDSRGERWNEITAT